MVFPHLQVDRVKILGEALERVQALSHLYRKQLLTVGNQKIKETLEKLAQEKEQHGKSLEAAISTLGGDAGRVRIPQNRPVEVQRELIPRIYQQEQDLYFWYRDQISAVQDNQVKGTLEMLLKDEQHHLQALKDLYRGVTHC